VRKIAVLACLALASACASLSQEEEMPKDVTLVVRNETIMPARVFVAEETDMVIRVMRVGSLETERVSISHTDIRGNSVHFAVMMADGSYYQSEELPSRIYNVYELRITEPLKFSLARGYAAPSA